MFCNNVRSSGNIALRVVKKYAKRFKWIFTLSKCLAIFAG